ncbi:MAG: BatA domain-containing protein, partial [Planctomycetota bacterium]
MIDGFLHPALAWGALLAVVPLAIHLLTRQRHRPLEWGAMRFVLAAYKRTQRRARLEHLLLLLLRMLAVIFLALALGRPFTGERSLLAPLTESRENLVVILDASASTGFRDPVEPVFQRVLDRSRELLRDLDGSRGDRAQVILGGASPTLLPARDPESLLGLLETVSEPTDGEFNLVAALDLAVEALEEDGAVLDGSGVQVWLLSDLQAKAFVGEASRADAAEDRAENEADEAADDRARGLSAPLDRLQEKGWPLIVEDLGPPALTPANSAIADLALEGPPVGVG